MKKKTSVGLTLIELMVVMAILAILITMGWMAWHNQINKANDADRKGDLQRIQIAFEDYYNDHNCYPPADILDQCGDNDPGNLKPYLEKIPCDPITHQPYHYVPDNDYPTCGRNFRVLTHLDNSADPIAADLSSYCTECNYGVSSTNVNLFPGASALPSASPSPTIDYYACQSIPPYGCTYRGTTQPACPYYWQSIGCNGVDCTIISYQCPE